MGEHQCSIFKPVAMVLTKEQIDVILELAKPLIAHLANEHDAHLKVTVESDGVEIAKVSARRRILEHLKG